MSGVSGGGGSDGQMGLIGLFVDVTVNRIEWADEWCRRSGDKISRDVRQETVLWRVSLGPLTRVREAFE